MPLARRVPQNSLLAHNNTLFPPNTSLLGAVGNYIISRCGTVLSGLESRL